MKTKKYLLTLVGAGDITLSLVAPEKEHIIGDDNDLAIEESNHGVVFDSVQDLVEHIQDEDVEVTGEFIGSMY